MRNILTGAALCFVLATAPAKAVEYNIKGTTSICFSIVDALVDEVEKCFDAAGKVRKDRHQRKRRDFCKSYLTATYGLFGRCNDNIGRCGSVDWHINGSVDRRGDGSNIDFNAECPR